MKSSPRKHNQLILAQFTKQAVPFAQKIKAHSNQLAFELIRKTAGINQQDNVLDVACGPGLLGTALAPKVSHVTGIDLVPSMIRQARRLQKEKKLTNMNWKLGDVSRLPFVDASFSAVVTRFSFHHFLKPAVVFREMMRVAVAGGKVAVIDVFEKSPAHGRWHNRLEKWRDESHVKILSLPQLKKIAKAAGLIDIKIKFYRLEIESEAQLNASFPKPGNAFKIRRLLEDDKRGIVSMCRGKKIYIVYPIVILAGRKS